VQEESGEGAGIVQEEYKEGPGLAQGRYREGARVLGRSEAKHIG
jgi:hypothetical protein